MKGASVEASNPFILLRWWQVTPEPVTQLAQQAEDMIDVPIDTGRYLIANGIGAGLFNRSQITPELIGKDVVEIEVVDLPSLYRDSALVRLTRNSTLSAAATHFIGNSAKVTPVVRPARGVLPPRSGVTFALLRFLYSG